MYLEDVLAWDKTCAGVGHGNHSTHIEHPLHVPAHKSEALVHTPFYVDPNRQSIVRVVPIEGGALLCMGG